MIVGLREYYKYYTKETGIAGTSIINLNLINSDMIVYIPLISFEGDIPFQLYGVHRISNRESN